MTFPSALAGMRRVLLAPLLAASLLTTGCASPLTRPQTSNSANGYSETRIDASHYLVAFSGSGYTSKDQAWFFWLYRCAELTRAQGFSYFRLENTETTASTVSAADQTAGAFYDGVYRPEQAQAWTRVSYQYSANGSHKLRWQERATVAMYRAPAPPDVAGLLVAQTVLDQLTRYVASGGRATAPTRQAVMDAIALPAAPARAARIQPAARQL